MIIPDDMLRDDYGVAQVLETLHEEARGWSSSIRGKSLKARYWNAQQSVFLKLNVRWDFRSVANRLNWEVPDDYLSSSTLHECKSKQLLSLLEGSHNLQFHGIFKQVTENIFLRVVGHWENGTPLTPPVLKLRNDGKLGRGDGFHRLAVAFAAKVPRVPFWTIPPVSLPGVSQISPANWPMQGIGFDENSTPRG